MCIDISHGRRSPATPKLPGARGASRASGTTIFEFLVAMAIGGLVLAQVGLLWFYSTRSFAAQMSYADMNMSSQRALDTLSQNIRGCKALTSFSKTKIVFVDYDNQPLTFAFEFGRLNRTKNGVTKTLLKDCQNAQFAMYQRTPIAGQFEYHPVTDPDLCKMVEVSWMANRRIWPSIPVTTESMRAARIVMRVK